MNKYEFWGSFLFVCFCGFIIFMVAGFPLIVDLTREYLNKAY